MGLLGTQVKPVPDVKNMTVAAATTLLEESGFVVGTVEPQFNETVPKGKIIDQTPGRGHAREEGHARWRSSSARARTWWSFPTSSASPRPRPTPHSTDAGLTSRAASSAYDPKIPAGSVISQDPKKGDQALRNSAVSYVISLGAEQAIVPDVEGMGKSKATKKLQDGRIQGEGHHLAERLGQGGRRHLAGQVRGWRVSQGQHA